MAMIVVQVVEEANKIGVIAKALFLDGYLVIHKVDAYEIGSEKDQAIIDEVQREMDPCGVVCCLLFAGALA